MRFINRYIGSMILAAALVTPTVTLAAPLPQDAAVQVRVYDRDHKDYHNWDDREDHVYRQYLTDNHRAYRTYDHQNRSTQRAYWNWRHEHPDSN
jgi:hypothetical protein